MLFRRRPHSARNEIPKLFSCLHYMNRDIIKISNPLSGFAPRRASHENAASVRRLVYECASHEICR